jgi:hypothetical protein
MSVGGVDLQPLLDHTVCWPLGLRGIRQGDADDVAPRGCTNEVGA